MRLIRSLLFAPANRPDLIEKFPRYAADAFAIDLEDGTPESGKEQARRELPRLVTFLRERELKGALFVRVNHAGSPHAEPDLAAATSTAIDGIVEPKLETAEGLKFFATGLTAAEARSGRALELIGIIETVRGIMNVEALAGTAGSHLSALAFGAEDFITDIGGRRTPEGLEVLYARSRVVLAARAAAVTALDLVFANIRDEEGFRRDAQFGRQLGYHGKLCVTPRQVEIANEIFSPSPEEIEHSRRLIQTYAAAEAEGRGTVEFEGQMIDEPILRRARAILDAGKVESDEDR